jgi:hypothetical protein
MRWLDRIPLTTLIVIAVLLGLAPFTTMPHLAQKLGMLAAGTLSAPLDVFDLLMHGAPAILLFLKLLRMVIGRR